MRTISCVVGVVACLAGRAEADVSKAWQAAKDNLPANTQFVLAVDVAAAAKSSAFAKAIEMFKSLDREIGEVHAKITKACGWDPVTVVDGFVLAGDHRNEEGIVYVQLKIDRAKASACFASALKAMGGKADRITIKEEGAYTVASKGTGNRDNAYFPWVGGNVVAISIKPDRKEKVDGWFGQKGWGQSKVAAAAAKMDLKQVASGAFGSDATLDRKVPVTSAYATWTLGGGRIGGALVATVTDANAAAQLAAELNKELQRDIKRDRTPPALKKVLGAMAIAANGNTLTMKGSATEKDFIDAIGEALGGGAKKEAVASKPDPDSAKWVAKLDEFSRKICQCKDKACADKVNEEMTKWGTEMAKDPKNKDKKPDPAVAQQVADIMKRYTDCMMKVYAP